MMGVPMKIEQTIGRLLNTALSLLGFQLSRKMLSPPSLVRHTLRGTLQHAKTPGFEPKTVFDVGAGIGTFELYETFPEARHVLIDPLEENRPFLERIVNKLKNAEYLIAAATQSTGTVTINVHRDCYGSSIYKEFEGSNVDGTPRVARTITLDELSLQRKLHSPYLIKVMFKGQN